MFKKTSTSLKKSIEESSDNTTETVIEEPDTDMNSTPAVTEEAAVETTTSANESESDNEEAQKSEDVNLNSDECDKAAPEKSVETTSSDQVDSSATINQTEAADETNAVDKPSVPIQTYLWEDVKRAKEQVRNFSLFFYCMRIKCVCTFSVHPTLSGRVSLDAFI